MVGSIKFTVGWDMTLRSVVEAHAYALKTDKQASPKCLYIYTRLYCAKSQKTSFKTCMVESKTFINLPFVATLPIYW